ncbi:MAG: M3 family oligoendopeptidase [Vulcanimicrobiota bacterium]
MSQSVAQKELPRWDLSDLYNGVDDPKIEEDLSRLDADASKFQKEYEGTIIAGELATSGLRKALDHFVSMIGLSTKIGSYASLHYSTKTTDPTRGALLQKIRERSSRVSTKLIFFDLELGQVPEEVFARYLESPELAIYRHYLKVQRESAKYHLSQAEETVLEETANCRGRAFRRLFTETVARMKFELEIDGEVKSMTQSELLAYNYNPDRKLREKASLSLATTLEANAPTLTFIMNTLLAEKEVMDRLRGYTRPESSRHLDNELPDEAVDTMVEVCVKNFDIVEEYYRLKSRLLGLESLTHFDRYAPLKKSEESIAYEKACDIVLEAYKAFSPELHELARPFFEENWIDVPVDEGKRGGAFCAGVSPDHHPYILLNYTEKPRDVMTLAHELGHGVHDRLASKNHVLDYHPVLPLAETASTFGEMLTFEKLFGELTSDEERLALLCEKLEDTFATVFRQVSMFRFERRIHEARRTEGELATERFNEMWQECMGEMFGEALTLGDAHKWTWAYIPHIIQTPFYVYAYAFGELLVLSLYARYQEQGQSFIAQYLDFLAAGGSQSPQELLGKLNIDVTDPDFWQGGCDLIRHNLKRAQELATALS